MCNAIIRYAGKSHGNTPDYRHSLSSNVSIVGFFFFSHFSGGHNFTMKLLCIVMYLSFY